MKLTYAIKFVGDMDRAVAFHRDTLGLTLRFASPGWSEFDTGDTTLALHIASPENPPGKVELGFGGVDVPALYAAREAKGLTFSKPPETRHGQVLAGFLDSEGGEVRVSSPAT